MKFKTRHEIVGIGLVCLVLYFALPRLTVIAHTSGMWVCHFCLANVLNPQGQVFLKIVKTFTLLTFFCELFGIGWATRLLLAKTLRTIRRFKQQHSQQATSRT